MIKKNQIWIVIKLWTFKINKITLKCKAFVLWCYKKYIYVKIQLLQIVKIKIYQAFTLKEIKRLYQENEILYTTNHPKNFLHITTCNTYKLNSLSIKQPL